MYHLLFDMCRYVDGRVWPTSDKTDVLLFLSLMHHVTGQSAPALHHPVLRLVLCIPPKWAHAVTDLTL